MKRTSGKRWISLVLALCLCLLVGCGGKQTGYDPLKGVETRMITDSAGPQVAISAEITRIAPSGSTAQMILMPVAYDLLVGLSSSPSTAQMSYFPEEMRYLPTFGQFYGSKANLNMESLIAAQPQLIIDLGDAKDSIAKDMDTIQKQTGIPTIFIEADLDDMAAAYRMLGDILGRQEQAEELAAEAAGALTDGTMTEREQAEALYRYLTEHVKYDRRYYSDRASMPYHSQTAIGALREQVASCGGYSHALDLLFEQVGIPCDTVICTSGCVNHMWNFARLDGQWLWFDATADRGMSPQFEFRHFAQEELDPRYSWDASQLDQLLAEEAP